MSDEYFEATAAAPVWELSGWWRRVGASFIDYFIVWIPVTVLVEVFGLGPDAAPNDYSIEANLDVVGLLGFLVASSIYFMVTMSAWNGQTVGKKVTGIRVVREDGE